MYKKNPPVGELATGQGPNEAIIYEARPPAWAGGASAVKESAEAFDS